MTHQTACCLKDHLPETIVFGALQEFVDELCDTPRSGAPKPTAETEVRRNLAGSVFGMAQILGYARDSTREQMIDAQVAELRAAGCERIFADHGVSSRIADRPEWRKLLDVAARPGHTIEVRRLDRIAGTERMMIEVLHDLDDRGLNIV